MNIVHSEGREPRLVDNSVCNMPCSRVLQQSDFNQCTGCFSYSWKSPSLGCFCSDVKAAHKSERESDQGILGIQAGGQYFFYKLCHFGATLSAMWFARLRSFFVRALLLLIFVQHARFLSVDDFLLLQDIDVLDITASLCVTFCGCVDIRLSWRKLQLGACVVWIGWEINSHAGACSVPQKRQTNWLTLLRQCFATVPRSTAEICIR